MAVNKVEWMHVEDDLFEYEVLGAMEQRYIFDSETKKYYFQFKDEEMVDMDEDELKPEIVAALKDLINKIEGGLT